MGDATREEDCSNIEHGPNCECTNSSVDSVQADAGLPGPETIQAPQPSIAPTITSTETVASSAVDELINVDTVVTPQENMAEQQQSIQEEGDI